MWRSVTWARSIAFLSCAMVSAVGEPEPLSPIKLISVPYGSDGRPIRDAVAKTSTTAQITCGKVVETQFLDASSFGFSDSYADPRLSLRGRAPVVFESGPLDVRVWTSAQGLPANKIRALRQTRDGFLWLGTVGGLVRFDGSKFETFDEANTPEMRRHGSVGRVLHEDDEGSLWIGTKRGMLRRKGNAFVPFEGQEAMRGRLINAIIDRTPMGLWIAHDGGVCRLDESGVTDLELEDVGRPLCLLEEGASTLWIGSSLNLFECNRSDFRIERSIFLEAYDSDVSGKTTDLMLDRRNQLWIARRKGVWRLDAARQRLSKIEALPKPSSEPGQSRFASDHLGRIWATNSYGEGIGVFQATSPSGRWIELPGLTATYAMHVCADGAAWIGTREGLLRVRGQAFGSVRIEANTAALNAPIHAITQTPDGRLWFRTPSSFGSWSGKTLWVCHQTGGHYRFWPIAVSGESAWTAHSQGGIFKLPNYLETPIADTSIDPEYSEIGAVSRLVSGSLDSLWICAEAGLYRLWCQDSRLERVANTDGLVINVMHETEAGSFWVGGPQGLRCLKDGKLVAVELGNGEHIEITAMFRSRDGQFWVGTVRGLAVYDERTSALRFFDESINLPKTSISGIFEDDRGRIWLNHDAGVSSVAITDLDQSKRDFQDWCDVTTFGVSDGLPGLNTSPYESTVVRGNDGRLWFVKDRGLAVVDSFNATSAQRPIIHLEEVTSDNLPVVLGAETQTKFRAPSRLSFRFSVASLQSSGEAMVQYQLENHDLTWQDAGKSRQVTYDYLGPDDYRFRIRARNHRGLWSHESEGFDARSEEPAVDSP